MGTTSVRSGPLPYVDETSVFGSLVIRFVGIGYGLSRAPQYHSRTAPLYSFGHRLSHATMVSISAEAGC